MTPPAINGSGGTVTSGGVLYSFTIPEFGGFDSNGNRTGGYDANGNLLTAIDSIMGQWNYSYDNLNRLVGASASTSTIQGVNNTFAGVQPTWVYDAFGNRTSETWGGTGTATVPANSNAHFTSANQLSDVQYTYDAAGNVTYDGLNSYLYDGEGRICAVKNQSGSMTGYIYDASGIRVAKGLLQHLTCDFNSADTYNSSTNQGFNGFQTNTSWVLGPEGEQVTEYSVASGASTWVHTNAFASGSLLATYHDTDTYFALEDWLGTKRAEVSAGGCFSWFTSMAFGNGLTPNGNCVDATEQHFTGKERDTESGNDYFGKRYYASSMGRWMSPDRINVTEDRMMNPSSTLNKYAYGANNPLKYVDPDGQDITIYFEAGNPYPGYTMLLAYNQETGDSATRSFGPDHSRANTFETAIGLPVPGTDRFGYEDIKSPDDLRQHFTSYTIQTTPEEAQEVINEIRTHPDGNYTTYWNNCTTSCSKLLRLIKQSSSHALTPMSFFQEIWGQEHGGSGRSVHSYDKGQDYGHPRQGYDPFQMFFWLTGSNDKSSVKTTVTNCVTDSNGQKHCDTQ